MDTHSHPAIAFVAATIAVVMMSCNAPPNNTTVTPFGPKDQSGVEINVSSVADVANIEITVKRVSCNGESIEPFLIVQNVPVADGVSTPNDVFIKLDPGCYDVFAQPLTQTGTPSTDCESMFIDQLVVIKGSTTEVGLAAQCVNKPIGAIDVYAKTTADVVAAQFTLERVSCKNESVKPQTFVEMGNALLPQYPYIEAFFVVLPGCFDLHVAPRKADGTPSDACQSATIPHTIVIDGSTTEIGVEFVCP